MSLQRNQRITFYACWVYSDQLIADDPYTLLRPVISLCVLTTPMLSNVCELHLEFWLLTATGVKLTDDLQVHLFRRIVQDQQRVALPQSGLHLPTSGRRMSAHDTRMSHGLTIHQQIKRAEVCGLRYADS